MDKTYLIERLVFTMMTTEMTMEEALNKYWDEVAVAEKFQEVPATPKITHASRRRTPYEAKKATWRKGKQRQKVAKIYFTEVPADGYLRQHQMPIADFRGPRHGGRDLRYAEEAASRMRDDVYMTEPV